MMRAALALLLVSPLAVAADGSWSSSSFGGTMTLGQQALKSKPVQSPSPPARGGPWPLAYTGRLKPTASRLLVFAFACAAPRAA